MSRGYPDPEIWPNDTQADIDEHEPKGEELAREVLDDADLGEYLRQRRNRW